MKFTLNFFAGKTGLNIKTKDKMRKKNHCSHIAESIDEASDFAKENPSLAKQIGWAIIVASATGGFAAVTWGIYFLTK